MSAFIVGWKVQVYGKSPADGSVYDQDWPGAISRESKPGAIVVAVCANKSLFTQITVSPGRTARVSGENRIASIVTV